MHSCQRSDTSLREVCVAVEYMHTIGWVHRDISAGNVLLVGDDGVISDLEYAVKLDSSAPRPNARTGTPFFMACEVGANKYQCFNRTSHYRDLAVPPFYYNPLHGPLSASARTLIDLCHLWNCRCRKLLVALCLVHSVFLCSRSRSHGIACTRGDRFTLSH